MAFQVEAWWAANYNKYSIRDMQRLPVFHRFVQLHYPFERSDEDSTERFWTENTEVDIYEWTQKTKGRVESFAHNRKLKQFHYEVKYEDEESPVIISSWFQQELEWGTIVRDYGDYQVQEGWRLEPPNRLYERFTTERGVKRGFRAGIFPYKGEYERWIEEIWEMEDEHVLSKQWHRQGESGGETTNTKGEYTWGESWFSNTKKEEQKCWHKDGVHEWGHDQGKEGPKRWDHSWDFTPEDKYEEKVSVTNGRDTGYRYWGKGADWYKQEWEGLHLLEREDRSDELVSAKFRSRLDSLYVKEYDSTLKSQHLIDSLLPYLPEFEDRAKDLEKRRADIHVKDRENTDQLMDNIEALKDVQDDQDKLIADMFGGARDELKGHQAKKFDFNLALDNSMLTLKDIGDILQDPSAHEAYVPKVEAWKEVPRKDPTKLDSAKELLDELENVKREELKKFKGGIPKEELERAMETLYQIMIKHDAVSDKIVDLTMADDYKKQLDGMEDTFESIYKTFVDEGDPNKLHQMLNLLLEYQPIHLHLVSRIRGFNKGETDDELGRIDTAVSETKKAPSMKNTRVKVRSGKPSRDTPFQVMDKNINWFVPLFQRLLKTVDAPKEDIDLLDTLKEKSVNTAEPVEVLVEKTRLLNEIIGRADPSIDAHDETLKTTDDNLNAFLTSILPKLKKLPEAEAIVPPSEALIEKSKDTVYFPPLLKDKSEALRDTVDPVKEFDQKDAEKTVEIGNSLTKFIPLFIGHLRTVNAPKDAAEALKQVAAKEPDQVHPLNTVAEQADTLLAKAEEAVPSVKTHDDDLKKSDDNLNLYFQSTFPRLRKVPEGDALVAAREGLIAKSPDTVYLPPLIKDKTGALKEQSVPEEVQWKEIEELAPKANSSLNQFIPLFVAHLKNVSAPEETIKALEAAIVPLDEQKPLTTISEQAETLVAKAQEAEPSLASHQESLKKSDANLNKYFEAVFPILETIEGSDEYIAPTKELIAQTETCEYFPPLVEQKTEQLEAIAANTNGLVEALNQEIETITETNTETTTIVEELQRTLSDKSELIDQLQKKIKELDRRIHVLDEDLEEAKKYKPLFEDRDEQATKLGNEVKDLSLKLSDTVLERDGLAGENSRLTEEVRVLTDFRIRALDLEQENQRLLGVVKTYEDMLGDKKSQFQSVIDNINREKSELDAKIRELLAKIEAMGKEIEDKENGRKKQLMLRVIAALAGTLKAERVNTFLLWKFTSAAPEDIPPESVLDKVPETAGFQDETLVEPELQSFRDTEAPLVEERKQQISGNIVAKHIRLSALKFTKLAKPFEALEFWDKMLDSKFEYDKEDLEGGKRPLLCSEFALEHLLKTLGNRRSAQDLLCSHLPTLYRLAQDGQPYAVLISRLAQLFNGSPAPLEGQVLVVQYRKLFQPLFEAYLKSRTDRKLPEKSPLDLAASGGEALLSTVLTTFYDKLVSAQFIVEHWLRHLKPSNVSSQAYILHLIYWRLQTTGGNAGSFWSAADPSGSGIASGASLVAAVQGLGLQVSARLLGEAGGLSKTDFEAHGSISLDDDRYVVPKAGFLTGILEAFLARVRRAAVIYTGEFAKKGAAHLGKADFVATSSALEPGHDAAVFEKIYDEALPLSSTQDGVDSAAFVRVWLRHLIMPIGLPPVAVPEMHLMTESRVLEHNLETGIKTSTTTTTTTTVKKTTTKKVILKKS